MGLRYTFANVAEFVRFLEHSALDNRTRAQTHSERSHKRAELIAEANAYDRVAAMVKSSNLVATT